MVHEKRQYLHIDSRDSLFLTHDQSQIGTSALRIHRLQPTYCGQFVVIDPEMWVKGVEKGS